MNIIMNMNINMNINTIKIDCFDMKNSNSTESQPHTLM